MYDSVATLKAYATISRDEYGNPVTTIEETEVFVQPRGVYQSEFYNAAQLGLKPSLTLMLTNREDYNGQKYLEFEGKEYEVIRTDWNAQRDGLSLICEERVKNGS
jgi:SPP1 family predicted phage head-tail adaptor